VRLRPEIFDRVGAAEFERNKVSAERRELPWVKIEKNYVFDAPNGKETLADLFDGRSQLIVYHFMFGPPVRDGKEGCKSCSFLVDHVDGANVHLAHHDVTFVAVSRTPLSQIEPFKNRMGWRFKWVSSYGSDFNYDFHVSATKDELAKGRMYYNYEMVEFQCEEQPGISVFYKDKSGDIFTSFTPIPHTGAEATSLLGTYNYLDLTPFGRREEKGQGMEWVRHHDRYD
jgi:predicted dithiol-disulfide oxidoreductase (DUF899 family)